MTKYKYKITASSPLEYERADRDPKYSPLEYTVCEFSAESHRAAEREFKRRVKHAKPQLFRPQLVELDD